MFTALLISIPHLAEKMEGSASTTNLPTIKGKKKFLVKYSTWFHPYLTWIDLFLNLVLACLVRFHHIARYKPILTKTANDKDSDETKQFVTSLRARLAQINKVSLNVPIQKWSKKTISGEIVECVYKVRQTPNSTKEMLQSWGVLQTTACHSDGESTATSSGGEDETPFLVEEELTILLYLPRELLPVDSSNLLLKEKTCYGCLQMKEQFDFAKLPEHVPIVLFFHGGGFVAGTANDGAGIELLADAIEASSVNGTVVFASVQYRLAPEWIFPAAPVDTLTALDHVLGVGGNRPIHIVGISAGGNLAALAAIELVRRQQKMQSNDTPSVERVVWQGSHNVKSCMVLCPMLDPAADSLSYYQHSECFLLIQVSSLRWCWRAVMNFPNELRYSKKRTDSGQPPSSIHEVLAEGSNRTAWAEWRKNQKNPSLERLANPTLGISDLVFGEVTRCPKFTVLTTRADPFQDEDLEFARKLKGAGASVHLVHGPGSHWLGAWSDKVTYQAMVLDLANYLAEPCKVQSYS